MICSHYLAYPALTSQERSPALTCIKLPSPLQTHRRLLVIPPPVCAAQKPPPALHLLFETPDLDAAYARAVAAGAVSLEPPATRSCGRTMAYVRDPHGGVLIELLQELEYPFFLKAASTS